MLVGLLRRGVQVTLYSLYYGTLFLFSRKRPVVLRKYLQQCGAGFVKMGQILAMRYDLLPEQYCLELSGLLDKLPPIPFKSIEETLAREFGGRAMQLFLSIDPVPLATASIAQVHAARLHAGEQVVIKVLLPNARRSFEIDLKLFKAGCGFLHAFGFWGSVDWRQLVADITRLTREEMDFRKEARNIKDMHEQMKADEIAHYAPLLYPDLCGREVITMEKIEGVSVSALLNAIDKKDEAQLEAWSREGVSPKRTACILLRSFLEQSMNYRFFHADPHAANLIVMKDGILGWVDFGMLGWLDEKVWFGQYNMRLALAQQNIQKAYTYFVRTLGPLPDRDLSSFENEIKGHLREWVTTANMPGASIAEKSSGFFFLRIFATVRKEKIPMPMDMVRLYRAILISDIVMLRLYPEIDWVSVLKDFLIEKERRRLIELTSFMFDPSFYSRILETAAVAPDATYSLSQWLREGLPLLRRDLKTQLTRLDRTWLALLRMGRNLSGLFVLYMICHRLFRLSALYTDGWRNTGTWLYDHSLALGLTGFVMALFWNNLIRSFK